MYYRKMIRPDPDPDRDVETENVYIIFDYRSGKFKMTTRDQDGDMTILFLSEQDRVDMINALLMLDGD